MSRPISESLSLLSETLGNCKTNLKEKSVEDVDNIKISDVDEKIAEIQAGGVGGGLDPENSKHISLDNDSVVTVYNIFEDQANSVSKTITVNLSDVPNDNHNYHCLFFCNGIEITDESQKPHYLEPEQNYSFKITFKGIYGVASPTLLIIITKHSMDHASAPSEIFDIKLIKTQVR